MRNNSKNGFSSKAVISREIADYELGLKEEQAELLKQELEFASYCRMIEDQDGLDWMQEQLEPSLYDLLDHDDNMMDDYDDLSFVDYHAEY